VLAGCGVDTPDITVPTIPSGSSAEGDAATFVIDGQTIFVRQSGSVGVEIGGAPQVTYSGPLGCKGQYFTAALTEHVRMYFHYGPRNAWLYVNGRLYHFAGAPKRGDGSLTWDRRFPDRHIGVVVNCPRPRPLG
jgi:hypothetical protein